MTSSIRYEVNFNDSSSDSFTIAQHPDYTNDLLGLMIYMRNVHLCLTKSFIEITTFVDLQPDLTQLTP